MILAAFECTVDSGVICTPEFVNDLFEGGTIFRAGDFAFTRIHFLFFLAAFIVIGLMYFAFRTPQVVPGTFSTAMASLVSFVRDEIAVGIIGPEGVRYVPYLLSLFFFLLIGNLFEVTPFVNFPITSKMALPLFLALVTWVIFVVAGIAKQGFRYFLDIIWPPGVPIAMRWLVGIIELVSIFLVRPFSLAVRIFANLVAGHVMLSLLLTSGFVFITAFEVKSLVGIGWFTIGLGIFVFEIVVSVLQAYIFTLLSAVYIQTSVHPEH